MVLRGGLMLWGALALILISSAVRWAMPISLEHSRELIPPVLPKAPARADGLLAEIMSGNLWDQSRLEIKGFEGSTPDASQSTETMEVAQVDWKLWAVSADAEGQFAVISSDQGKSLYRVGNELPNQEELVEILYDGVVIKQGEALKRVYLFGKE